MKKNKIWLFVSFISIMFLFGNISFVFALDAPTSLTATAYDNQRVVLTWSGSSEYYRIYRDGQELVIVAGLTTHPDLNVPVGNHTYEVSAITMASDGYTVIDESGRTITSVTVTSTTPPPSSNTNVTPSTNQATSGLLPIIQCGNEGQHMCTLCDIFETISRVINIILIYSFAIGGGLLAVGGIMMYFGGSNSQLLGRAKKLITGVIVGIAIMLVSYLIVFTIISVLSGGTANTYFNIKNGGFLIECES